MGKDLAIQLFPKTHENPLFLFPHPYRQNLRIHNKQWGLWHLYLNPHFSLSDSRGIECELVGLLVFMGVCELSASLVGKDLVIFLCNNLSNMCHRFRRCKRNKNMGDL